MDPEKILIKIVKNKAKPQPYIEAVANHKQLLAELKQILAEIRKDLEAKAFEDTEQVFIDHPFEAVRSAIKNNNPQTLKQAARSGYDQKAYSALRLAAEADQDINALVDFLATYGELQTLNQRVFMRAALSDPPRGRFEYG